MCYGEGEWETGYRILYLQASKKLQRYQRMRRSRVRVHRFIGKGKWENESEKEIEVKNLKLYLENKIILEKNRQLRKKALLLRQENVVLLSEFKKRFSHQLPNKA